MRSIDAAIIQQIIAPATMIPACGLLLLSTTSRMNTVLARVRAFHQELLSIWKEDAKPGSRENDVRELRLEGLEHQTHRLLSRASMLRSTMLLLFLAIACNLLAVIGMALPFAFPDSLGTISVLAVIVFMCGITLMIVAMATSILEILWITETVRYEHRRVEALCEARAPAAITSMSVESGEGLGL